MCIYRELLPCLIGHPSIYRPILALLLAIDHTNLLSPLFNTLKPPLHLFPNPGGAHEAFVGQSKIRRKEGQLVEKPVSRCSRREAKNLAPGSNLSPRETDHAYVSSPNLYHNLKRHCSITRLLRINCQKLRPDPKHLRTTAQLHFF